VARGRDIFARVQLPRVVVLTGAGISAESGIRTFRASDGLWEDHRVTDVAHIDGFRRNPSLVFQFYNQRRRDLLSGPSPNEAHVALARFESELTRQGGSFLLVTQNVDDLHERAGSERLIHMHGELLKVRCQITEQVFSWRDDCDESSTCVCCGRRGSLRPHIVWFGEVPLDMDVIGSRLMEATHFVSIGTSGNVYPAADFVRVASRSGALTVELNLEPTSGSPYFDLGHYGPASEVVPRYFGELRSELLP
jgi:NAD-dependent deacetylase